ncbi:MAG: hypothetical protein MRERC_2c128 [Mycoplasmataceae bacterium RC_NB112A]|nr:MAG: hypothetical protein MRERC_2c128 [Mycoplasmataceae bacterium RC_NB112A]
MKTKIITGPIKPYESIKVGLSVLPMVAEALQCKTENEATLALNCLDSFTKRSDYMQNYLQFIKDNGIKINDKWLDNEHLDSLKREVYKLIELGYISEKEKIIHRCKCIKVEVSSESVNSIYNTKCFDKKNSKKIICNFCNTETVEQKEKVLVFTVLKNSGSNINILPRHLGADISEIHNKKIGKDIVISRTRDTYQRIDYKGTKYNIDIDFLLANYLSTFEEKEKVVIGSHHVVYQIYLLNLLEQCKHPNEPNNIVFVAVSHVKGLEEINFKNLNNDSKKLNVVYSATNLKKPNSKWEEDNYQYLTKKLSEKAKQDLINIAYKKVERKKNESLYDYVKRTMDEINLRKNLSELKKLKNIQKSLAVRALEVDLADLKKLETNELKNKAVKIIHKERKEKIKADIINNLPLEKQVKYNGDTCYKYTFITKEALFEINRRYHELHGQPHYIHNFLNLRPGEHTDIVQLHPELIKKGDCYLLIPNTSYCEMKELMENPKCYKNNKGGLRILGYYIHPEQLENTFWKISVDDLENEIMKKVSSSATYNYISKDKSHLERSASQEKISVIEARSNKKYLASILDLDKTDLNWLKYIKKISTQHLQENYGVTDQDEVLMYFHFPCLETNVTLHLHIVVNGINHPIHESKSFSLNSIISCLENDMSIEDVIMSRQTIMDTDISLSTDINGLEIKQIPNRYKVNLNKGKKIINFWKKWQEKKNSNSQEQDWTNVNPNLTNKLIHSWQNHNPSYLQTELQNLHSQLKLAYSKKNGQTAWENWETSEGLENWIKELEQKIGHLEVQAQIHFQQEQSSK